MTETMSRASQNQTASMLLSPKVSAEVTHKSPLQVLLLRKVLLRIPQLRAYRDEPSMQSNVHCPDREGFPKALDRLLAECS